LQPVAPGLYARDLLSQFRDSYLDVDLCCSRDRLSRARAELARASLTAVVLVPERTQSPGFLLNDCDGLIGSITANLIVSDQKRIINTRRIDA
jgi:hypothetical protein